MTNKPSYEELERCLSHSNATLDNLRTAIAIYEVKENGTDFIFTYINKAVEIIENITKEDVIGKSVLDVFPGIKDLGLLDVFSKVWKSGKAEHFPTALYKDNRICGWRANTIRKLSSTEIIAEYTDETERQEKEKSLRESEFFFQTVFDTIQDGITVLDMDMNIVKMNRAMERWYVPQKPFIGKKCYVTYHGRECACDDCPAKRAISTGNCHTKIVPRGGPAGTPGWIELTAFPIKNLEGNTVGAVEYVRNITARKTAEEEVKNSQKKLKGIIDFLPDPTWVIDNNGTVIQWNHALERLTNIPAEEMVGKGNYEYAIPLYGKRRPVLIDLVLNPDTEWEQEYAFLEKQDNTLVSSETYHPSLGAMERYLSGTASPLFDADGNTVGAIESVRDITEKKRMEQEKEKVIREELDKALSKIKLLRGLLPICASCKKIRDDNGYWNQIEDYLRFHSEVEFSHSLCPPCVKNLYGNEEWYKKIKNK